MAWTDLDFVFEQVLTTTEMDQLQANFSAMAAGDAGAPQIQSSAIDFTGPVIINEGDSGATADTNANDLVVESSAGGGISILTPDASASRIYFGSVTDPTGAWLSYTYDSNAFTIGTLSVGDSLIFTSGNNGEAARFDSSQNFLIGTSSAGGTSGATIYPTGKMHIRVAASGGTASTTVDDFILEGSGDSGMNILTPDANIGSIAFGSASLNRGYRLDWHYDNNEARHTTSVVGSSMIFRVDNSVLNLTLSGSAGSPLAAFEGNIRLQGDQSGSIFMRGGAAGTNSRLMWTFNTDSTPFAFIDLDYDTRATVGMKIDSGYRITYNAANGEHVFLDADSVSIMRTDTSNNFMIGKTAIDSAATAGQELWGDGQAWFGHSGDVVLTLNRLTSVGSILDLSYAGTIIGDIGVDTGGTELYVGGSAAIGKSGVQFGGAAWYPRDNGVLTDAGVDLGSTTYQMRSGYFSTLLSINSTAQDAEIEIGKGGNIDSTIKIWGTSDAAPTSEVSPAYFSDYKSDLFLSLNYDPRDGSIDQANHATAYFQIETTGSSTNMKWATKNGAGSAPTVFMTLSNAGALGVTGAVTAAGFITAGAISTTGGQITSNQSSGDAVLNLFGGSTSDEGVINFGDSSARCILEGGYGSGGGGQFDFYTDTTGNVNTIRATLDNVGDFTLKTNDSTFKMTGSTCDFTIHNTATGIEIGTPNGQSLFFQTNGADRLCIDASGNILINTSSTGGGFNIAGGNPIDAEITGNGGGGFNCDYTYGSGTGYFGYFKYGGTLVGQITSTGAGNCLFTQISDQRLKSKLVPVKNIKDSIMGILAGRGHYLANPEAESDMFTAQNLREQGFGYAVTEAKEGDILSADYSKLVPVAMMGIQDLYRISDASNDLIFKVENRVETLEKENEKLRERVALLEEAKAA